MLQARTGTAPQKSEMGLAGLWPGVGTGRCTGEACRARCHSERESDHRVGNWASRGGRTVGGRDHGGRACPMSCHSGGGGTTLGEACLVGCLSYEGWGLAGQSRREGVGPSRSAKKELLVSRLWQETYYRE